MGTSPASADVRVWTDREERTLKGNLLKIEVLPPTGPQTPARDLPPAPDSHLPPAPTGNLPDAPEARPAIGGVVKVGPRQVHTLPSQAARSARDGDVIEIAAGDYVDCAVWRANNLVLRGVGGRAHIRDKSCNGKAIWIIAGNNTTVENIEFSGMRVRDRNGAGIRHEGRGLTIVNSYFHDGDQGILGGGHKPGDVVLIEGSEFARLGRAGQAHNIYIGRADSFILRNSFVHDCVDEGNCVKSRAKRTLIECSVIASLAGESSWEIDIPEGGHATIRRNVIEQGPESANYGVIAFAAETHRSRRHGEQTLVVEDNLIINDRPQGRFFFVREHANTVVETRNNRFVGLGLPPREGGNRHFRNRAVAGLKPYPALPEPCGR